MTNILAIRVRENVIEGLTGEETKLFGLHSLRAGGGTAAVNLRVNDRLFKKHGRWKSEKVKDVLKRKYCSEINSYKKSRSLEVSALESTLRRLHYK